MCQNPVQSSVAHKETSFGFLFLKFQDTLKVRPDGGEKVEIIGDILSFIKSVFRQKYRKLGLNTKTWPKWFLEKIIVAQRFFRMIIEEHGIQSQLVFRGKAAVAKGFQLFFVLAADLICIFHVGGDGAKRGFFSWDALFFRMCQGIVKSKCAAGDFILKNFSGKGFKFSIFRDPMGGKIAGSEACKQRQDKQQSDKKRRFFSPDLKRHRRSFQQDALFYHIGKLRNL